MATKNFFADEKEWQYLFKNAIDWDNIIPLYIKSYPTVEGFNNKEEVISFYSDLLGAVGEWAAQKVAPRAKELDKVGSGRVENGKFYPSEPAKQSLQEALSLELLGISAPHELGGMGTPGIISQLMIGLINRACISTAIQISCHTTCIDMLERFGEEEDLKRLAPLVLKGEISGSMCLTEPGAGSDVGSLTTTAEKQPDGSYLLNGGKIFITNGGGGVALVLARIKGAPEGLKGISLFHVEEVVDGKQNYTVEKIEDKMGLKGSPTCVIMYENTKAKLIGQENKGFKYMLHLMNEARIAVGLQGLGGIEASLAYAREYAESRVQFGKPIIQLPLLKKLFEDWETERDAMRAMMFDTLSYFEIYQKLHVKKEKTKELSEKETALFNNARKWCRRRTPLVKYYGAETFTLLSQRAIQALGGYGFMKEYEAERLHRDSFAPLLYEGTSQIQSLMAMKDLVSVVMGDPAKYFRSIVFDQPLTKLTAADSAETRFARVRDEFKVNFGRLLIGTLRPDFDTSNPKTAILKLFDLKAWKDMAKIETLMTYAETICQAQSYIETLRVLSRHAQKDKARKDLFDRYFKLVRPRLDGIYSQWVQ